MFKLFAGQPIAQRDDRVDLGDEVGFLGFRVGSAYADADLVRPLLKALIERGEPARDSDGTFIKRGASLQGWDRGSSS